MPSNSSLLSLLAFQLQAGVEVIEQLSISAFDQFIHQPDGLWVIIALISKRLSDVRPVLLLHMRVVVFLVGPAAGHKDRPRALLQPVQDVVIEELSPIVTVQYQQLKGQAGFDILQGGQGPGLPSPPDRPHFHPGRRVVHAIDHPDEFSSHTPSTERDRIDFQPPGFFFLEETASNGYLLPQNRPRTRQRASHPLGPATEPAIDPRSVRWPLTVVPEPPPAGSSRPPRSGASTAASSPPAALRTHSPSPPRSGATRAARRWLHTPQVGQSPRAALARSRRLATLESPPCDDTQRVPAPDPGASSYTLCQPCRTVAASCLILLSVSSDSSFRPLRPR